MALGLRPRPPFGTLSATSVPGTSPTRERRPGPALYGCGGRQEAALAPALDARERAEDRLALPRRKQGCGAVPGKRPNCTAVPLESDPSLF